MADFSTLAELLAAQSEKKLLKLKGSIVTEIQRLGLELKLVEDALSRKARNRVTSSSVTESAKVSVSSVVKTASARSNGGLSRDDLLGYVREIDHPTTAVEVREFLAGKGIVRRIEAIRVALSRLQKAGELVRTGDGKFAVPPSNGDGSKVDDGDPLSRDPGFDMPGGAPPDG